MVGVCCVPQCSSNSTLYAEGSLYVSVFKFPADPKQRDSWKSILNLKDWQVKTNSVVCENHFNVSDIIVGEKRKTLKQHSLPKPVSVQDIIAPESLVEDDAQSNFHNDPECNDLNNFDDLKLKIKGKLGKFLDEVQWHFGILDTKIKLFKTDLESLSVIAYLQINIDMTFSIFHVNAAHSSTKIINKHIITGSKDITKIINHINNLKYILKDEDFINEIKRNICNFKVYLEMNSENNIQGKLEQLDFIMEQIEHEFGNLKHYSVATLLKSFLIFNHSPSAYDVILANKLLHLPSVRHLKRLKSSFKISPDTEKENIRYLKTLCGKLNDLEKIVILQIDEIYVNPSIQYRSGKLSGIAKNASTDCEQARTIQAFLISSAFGNFKSIASLVPVKKLKSSELHELVMKNLELLNLCGFRVLTIIADNNRLNQSTFRSLCQNSDNRISFEFNGLPIFVMYDTVHILKNVRNNWINLKNADKAFHFPAFDDNILKEAKFSSLQNLYKNESNSIVKMAPNLNYKTCFPTNLERQNVKLVMNIFNEKTISAIKTIDEETGNFMEIILKWWTLVNIKNPVIHTIKLNSIAKPFHSINDERLSFLTNFTIWINHWRDCCEIIFNGEGFLTQDTSKAICHSTECLINIIKYSLESLNVDYVLTGKFQTDNLERTFGKYRNLCGSNYNVSVQQVLEAEHKIRVNKLLGIRSARYGHVKFSVTTLESITDSESEASTSNDECLAYDDFLKILENLENYEEGIEESAVIYIAGYATYKVCNKLQCENCLNSLSEYNTDDKYFQDLNRGGLRVSSDMILHLAKLVIHIMNGLVSSEFENIFLKQRDHKNILNYLTIEGLKNIDMLEVYWNSDCEVCSVENKKILSQFISIFSNICLNNYRKLKTDVNIEEKQRFNLSKKRKLQTLT